MQPLPALCPAHPADLSHPSHHLSLCLLLSRQRPEICCNIRRTRCLRLLSQHCCRCCCSYEHRRRAPSPGATSPCYCLCLIVILNQHFLLSGGARHPHLRPSCSKQNQKNYRRSCRCQSRGRFGFTPYIQGAQVCFACSGTIPTVAPTCDARAFTAASTTR